VGTGGRVGARYQEKGENGGQEVTWWVQAEELERGTQKRTKKAGTVWIFCSG